MISANQVINVFRFVIRFFSLPKYIEDTDPLHSQGSHNGIKGLALLLSVLDVGLRPETKLPTLLGPLMEALPEEVIAA